MTRKWVKEALRKNELATISRKIVQFLSGRKKLITNIAVTILVIVILIPIGSVLWNKRTEKAMAKLAEAHMLYDKNSIEEAKKGYEEVIKDFSYTQSASEALFYTGNCYFSLEQYDKTIETYQKYIKKYPKKMLAPFAYEGIGLCKEDKGDYKGAIDTYRELIEKYPDHFIVTAVHMDIARNLVFLNREAEAKKEYQKILDFYPNSVWVDEAKKRIEGPKEEEPAKEEAKPAAKSEEEKKEETSEKTNQEPEQVQEKQEEPKPEKESPPESEKP